MRRRHYFLICFDSSVNTIDDFRWECAVFAVGRCVGALRLAEGDWFVLFDTVKESIVGHGKISVSMNLAQGPAIPAQPLRIAADVARQKNHPMVLMNTGLSFLMRPTSRRLIKWRQQAVNRLTVAEFNEIFNAWWGLSNFSAELPPG